MFATHIPPALLGTGRYMDAKLFPCCFSFELDDPEALFQSERFYDVL